MQLSEGSCYEEIGSGEDDDNNQCQHKPVKVRDGSRKNSAESIRERH